MPRIVVFCAVVTIVAGQLSAAEGGDRLTAGIRAYRAGKIDSAITLLSSRIDNPYLDAFRLYYRAECYVRDSLYRDAVAELDTLFALTGEGRPARKVHSMIGGAGELYIEALARGGAENAARLLAACRPSEIGVSGARWAFIASSVCLTAEDTSAAIRFLVEGAGVEGTTARPAPGDTALLKELILRYTPLFQRIPREGLEGIARAAAALRLKAEADAIVTYLSGAYPNDPAVTLCRADVIASSGALERALHLYWRLFYSPAPVKIKMSSLYGAASVEYRLKRFDKAAVHFRLYGVSYPASIRAPAALDTAARIYVLQREWNKALSTWRMLRKRDRGDPWRSDSGLSEAALYFRLGRKAEARRILRSLLPRRTGADDAGLLYWLMRTSETKPAETAWLDSLVRAWPRSFYAAVAVGGDAWLSKAVEGDSAGSRMAALAALSDRRRAAFDTVRADSAFEAHPGFKAFHALLEAGLGEEADMTVMSLIRIHDFRAEGQPEVDLKGNRGAARLRRIYAEALTHGRDALSLTLLALAPVGDSPGAFPWELRYPVAYVPEIEREAGPARLSPLLVLAVTREESRFNPNAVSEDGARGLMQLMPATASWIEGRTDSTRYTVDDLFDPGKNIAVGVRYLNYLLGRSGGCLVAALAAYNGGEGKMAAWNSVFRPTTDPVTAIELIGPQETRRYVKSVLESLAAYRAIADEQVKTR